MMKRFGKTLAHLLGRQHADDTAAGQTPPSVLTSAPTSPPAPVPTVPASPSPAASTPPPPPDQTAAPRDNAPAPPAPAIQPAPATPNPEPVDAPAVPTVSTTPPPPTGSPTTADMPIVAAHGATSAPADGRATTADDTGMAATDGANDAEDAADDDSSADNDDDDDGYSASDASDEADDDSEADDDDDDDDDEYVSRRGRRARADDAEGAPDRVFFGEEVFGASQRHRAATMDRDRLARFDLPAIASERELAGWLGITQGRLRWYAQDRPADTTWHYVRYTLPKRGGGERVILAPKPALKALQRKVLAELVARVPSAGAAHGFVRGHSIVTNAQQHVGKEAVLKLDLKDFFPSITFPRVRGLFIALGYSFPVASTLALLCTEHERQPYDREGTRYHISIGPRHLVQGAPTSPALANLVAWRLDRRLAGLAAKHHLAYTRYADDLTFSGDDLEALRRLRVAIQRIIRDERFTVNSTKTRLAGRSARQIVTGLVVNDAIAVPRAQRRRLRAILHNARASGLAAQNRENHPRFRAYLRGLIAHIHAANPAHAAPLRAELERATESDAGR